jgi:hypothetical protein
MILLIAEDALTEFRLPEGRVGTRNVYLKSLYRLPKKDGRKLIGSISNLIDSLSR